MYGRKSGLRRCPPLHLSSAANQTQNIICQPLLDAVDLTPYLEQIELVVVGGESDRNARPLDYSWVLRIREQCLAQGVHFQFRQCGTHFIKDDRTYTLPVRFQSSQAKKANINF